jgi:hypothetical protein
MAPPEPELSTTPDEPIMRMSLLMEGRGGDAPVTREEFIRYCQNDAVRLYTLVTQRIAALDNEKMQWHAKADEKKRSLKEALSQVAALEAELLAKEDICVDQASEIERLKDENQRMAQALARNLINAPASATAIASKRSMKLPDPPELTDGKDPRYEDWELMMKDKLKANSDHLDTPEIRMAYVVSRTKEDARKHLMPRRRADTDNPYLDVEDIFKHLSVVFVDPNKALIAREKLRVLRLTNLEKFPEFRANFSLLAAETELDRNSWKYELHWRLPAKMREITLNKQIKDSMSFDDFATYCSKVASNLVHMGGNQDFRTRSAGGRSIGGTTSQNRTRTSASPTVKTERVSHSPEAFQALTQQGRCYTCQKTGHIAKDCPDSKKNASELKTVEVAEEEPAKEKA